ILPGFIEKLLGRRVPDLFQRPGRRFSRLCFQGMHWMPGVLVILPSEETIGKFVALIIPDFVARHESDFGVDAALSESLRFFLANRLNHDLVDSYLLHELPFDKGLLRLLMLWIGDPKPLLAHPLE